MLKVKDEYIDFNKVIFFSGEKKRKSHHIQFKCVNNIFTVSLNYIYIQYVYIYFFFDNKL